jgi:MYXO-CTERM domain-containing protein
MLSCDLLMPYQAMMQQHDIPATSSKRVTNAMHPWILGALSLGGLLLRSHRRGMPG